MISDQSLMLLVGVAVLLFAMLVFLFIQFISQRAECKYYRSQLGNALDRLMAKDFRDYSIGRHIQQPTDAEELEKILDVTEEDRRAADGIPVN